MQETDEAMAVIELRKRLQTEGNVEKQIEQGGEAPMDDFMLLRFLRAEKFDVDNAEKRLREHAAWRCEFVPGGCITEDEIANELAEPHQCFLQGCNSDGKPLVVLALGRREPTTRDYEETKRFLCYTMDAAIASCNDKLNPEGKLSVILDMRELTFYKMDTNLRTVLFDILAGQYPERLHQMFLFEANYLVSSAWWAISSFVDTVTRDKFKFISGPSGTQELQQTFSSEVLPVEFGGSAQLVPIQSAVLPRSRKPLYLRDDSAETL